MIVSRMTTAVDLKLFDEVSKRIRLAIDAIARQNYPNKE